ncbi:hypothetical protein EAF04_000903 [Stromatinia cepivora]|nr:hypothetical protein EAF04_000903 [Stromatinia cepivora]
MSAEAMHPKFREQLEQFEADDLTTKLAEIKTTLEDILKKKTNGRAHTKEKIKLKTRTQEFINLCIEFGARPQPTGNTTQKINLSASSLQIIRRVFILVTTSGRAHDIQELAMELRHSVILTNDVVDLEAMWEPDKTLIEHDNELEAKLPDIKWKAPPWKTTARYVGETGEREQDADDGFNTQIKEFKWIGDEEEEQGQDIDMEGNEEEGWATEDRWYKFEREYSKTPSNCTGESVAGDGESVEMADVAEEDEGKIADDMLDVAEPFGIVQQGETVQMVGVVEKEEEEGVDDILDVAGLLGVMRRGEAVKMVDVIEEEEEEKRADESDFNDDRQGIPDAMSSPTTTQQVESAEMGATGWSTLLTGQIHRR